MPVAARPSSVSGARDPEAPIWCSAVLWCAAVYNVLWGVTTVALPNLVFEQFQMTPPNPIWVWQALNTVIGVLGIGYGLAAMRPFRHWPVVLIGLLGKLLGLAGFGWLLIDKAVPVEFGWLVGVNDLIWIVPFMLILKGAWRAQHPRPVVASGVERRESGSEDVRDGSPEEDASESVGIDHPQYKAAEAMALSTATRQATLYRGHMLSALSLREYSDKHPALVVFLRHLGCTFCREALSDISARRAQIEAAGATIVLVHMSHPIKAAKFFERYGLDDVYHISDPERRLYQAFELPRGKFKQLFGFQEFTRGFKVGILKGKLLGLPQGDGRQLGGAFVYFRRAVAKAYRTTRASDQPDLIGIGACAVAFAPRVPEADGAPSQSAGSNSAAAEASGGANRAGTTGAATSSSRPQAPPPRGNQAGSSPGRR